MTSVRQSARSGRGVGLKDYAELGRNGVRVCQERQYECVRRCASRNARIKDGADGRIQSVSRWRSAGSFQPRVEVDTRSGQS